MSAEGKKGNDAFSAFPTFIDYENCARLDAPAEPSFLPGSRRSIPFYQTALPPTPLSLLPSFPWQGSGGGILVCPPNHATSLLSIQQSFAILPFPLCEERARESETQADVDGSRSSQSLGQFMALSHHDVALVSALSECGIEI